MAISAGLQKSMRTWASLLMIAMFAVDMAPYRFSKRGDASASWDVSAEKDHSGSGRPSVRAFGKKVGRSAAMYADGARRGVQERVESLSMQDGLAKAAMLNEPVDLDVEFGLRELLSEIGEVRQPGVPSRPKAEQPDEPQAPRPQYPPPQPTVGTVPGVPNQNFDAPSQPRMEDAPEAPRAEPVTPVEAPVPDDSDASIILIERSARLSVEGLISELTVDVGRKTRGFMFPMPEKPCGESATTADPSGLPFPNGELRIPDDAASFVIPEPGVQTVVLSHPILTNTDRPMVIVMEHMDSAVQTGWAATFPTLGKVHNSCPVRVVSDLTTRTLNQRAISKPTVESEDIVAQIFGGKFDEVSGAYKVLTHRFSQPHRLVMHFLVKLSQLDALSLLHSTKTMLKTSQGYKLILPLADELGAKVDSEQLSDSLDGVELPVDRPRMGGLPVDIPRRRGMMGKLY